MAQKLPRLKLVLFTIQKLIPINMIINTLKVKINKGVNAPFFLFFSSYVIML